MSSIAENHQKEEQSLIEIDTWKFSLSGKPDSIQNHLEDLVGEERQRIEQGIFPELGERATRSRLGLRWILADYLQCKPHEVPLIIGEHGKPELDSASPHFQNLHFNLSHCGDRALMAVSSNSVLGVDLERVREESPIEDLAQRCFSEIEQNAWLESPADLRRVSFFHLWVQKEAMVKAHGDGMTLPLRLFSGNPDSQALEGTITSEIPEIGVNLWRYHAEVCSEDLRAAIVFRGKAAKIFDCDPNRVGLSRW